MQCAHCGTVKDTYPVEGIYDLHFCRACGKDYHHERERNGGAMTLEDDAWHLTSGKPVSSHCVECGGRCHSRATRCKPCQRHRRNTAKRFIARLGLNDDSRRAVTV